VKKVILDSNAYSGLLRGNVEVRILLEKADHVYMSVIVLGELYAGFKGGNREKQNREWLERFLAKSTVEVLDVTLETAEIFSDVMSRLKKNGTPVPINDVWLAAHTLETGAALITFDNHFVRVPGLRLAL